MPYYELREIKTPLILFGVRLYRDDTGTIWYSIFSGRKKRIKRN